MVYTPVGRPFTVRMEAIASPKVRGWWFNPRDGAAVRIGDFLSLGEQEFTPPDSGEKRDWVLVLDNAAKHFAAPGQETGEGR